MTESLPIKCLHHIALVTQRPEESAEFYREVLGFREMKRPPFRFRGAWLYNYGVQIHLIENPGLAQAPEGEINTRANHLAFAVENLAAVRTTLQAHGVAYRENINAGGVHQIFFRDPDGHHLEMAVHGDPAEEIA